MAEAFLPKSAKGVHQSDDSKKGAGVDADTQHIIDVLQEESMKVMGTRIAKEMIRPSVVSSFVACYGVDDAERIIRWLYSGHYNASFPVYKKEPISIDTQFMLEKFKWLAETVRLEARRDEMKREKEKGHVVQSRLRSMFELVR